MTQNGWRKPTPGLLQAERFAEVGEQLSIPKTRAMVAVKKVAAAIGLKAQDLLLLDTFGAVTQTQDWQEGRRPIVWASNTFLIEQTGFSLATLRRHLRRLCEAGVISMKDSPNGKRWGRRDAQGVIIEAYGFDLSPLAARAEAFEALHAQLQAERAQCASLRNAITVTRRMIRARIEQALEGHREKGWEGLQMTFAALLQELPKRSAGVQSLAGYLERIKNLLTSVEQRFKAAIEDRYSLQHPEDNTGKRTENSEYMTPKSLGNETHIRTTNELEIVDGTCLEKNTTEAAKPKLESSGKKEKPDKIDLDLDWSSHTNGTRSDIDIPMLMASCPHFAEMARGTGGYMRNWNDVHRAAAALRPIVGISEDAWHVANKVMGPENAAASIALILDKSSDGEVKSPGGYLRGLVEKAKIGELHLQRSFFGRLSEARG